MAKSFAFSWTDGSPTQIARTIQALSDRVPMVVEDIAASEASRAESWMKENAPWQDRTGNARKGLFGTVSRNGDVILFTLGGTEDYIPWLELGTRRMKPRRVIIPAHQRWQHILPDQVGLGLVGMFRA